jgi:two-component system sensor histidine kinase/response regulator
MMQRRVLAVDRHPRSIRFWLGSLVVACIVPALLAGGFLVLESYQRERASIERETVATTRALMEAIDADLLGVQTAVQVLALSPQLASGNLRGFYEEAQTLLASRDGGNYVLKDLTGQQLVNTSAPFGVILPREPSRGQIERMIATGKPEISDLFVGPVTLQHVLTIEVPVLVGGKVAYIVGTGLFAERLQDILRRQRVPEAWLVAVFDRTGHIIARTRNPERFIGKMDTPEFQRQTSRSAEGTYEAPTLDGVAVFGGFSKSPTTGWMVAFGVPKALLTGNLQRALLLNSLMGLFVVVLGALLAHNIGRRITRSIRALSAPALLLGSRESVEIPRLEISEVDELGRALVKASLLIEERSRQRDQAASNERMMLAAKAVADKANRMKSEFLTGMSHELRTPMNAILGFAQLLDGWHFGDLNEKQKEFVGHILFSGNHLLELIDDVLDLSKVEVGELSVAIERVDLVPLMTSVVASLGPSAEQAGIVLLPQDFGLGMPALITDRVRLAQILINLGSNAIKYNRKNGTVGFSYARLPDDTVRITVADTGIGIPADRQDELFLPFSRLRIEQTAIDGTGVGLALSRRLIELMGGTIGFASTLGQGSSFWVDCPIDVASEQNATLVPPEVSAA